MASRYAPKVRVRKVAMELIRAGKVPPEITTAHAMSREALLDEVEKIVQADRLTLTDDSFRIKYVNYIRNYWNKAI